MDIEAFMRGLLHECALSATHIEQSGTIYSRMPEREPRLGRKIKGHTRFKSGERRCVDTLVKSCVESLERLVIRLGR